MNILAGGFVLLFLDQLSKFAAQNLIKESIPVIPRIFHLTLVHNQGGAFGLLEGWTHIFLVVGVLTILFILVFLKSIRKSAREIQWAAALILGGASGNLVDRIRFGYVIDFLDFQVWPVFNVADSGITVGSLLLFWYLVKQKPEPNSS